MKPNVLARVIPALPSMKTLVPCLLAAGFFLLTACTIPLPSAQPDLTRYYLLTGAQIQAGADAGPALKRWVVGVRAVNIAPYLQTKSFAVRSQANEIIFLDSTRWGEPLDQGVARVLAENLQTLKIVGRVSTQPFRADEQRDFEILVSVSACEGTTNGEVRFTAGWRILAPTGSAGTVAEGSFSASGLRWDGHDYGQLAAKLSEALGAMSRDIAAALPKDATKS
jgi:uncharacterized protein